MDKSSEQQQSSVIWALERQQSASANRLDRWFGRVTGIVIVRRDHRGWRCDRTSGNCSQIVRSQKHEVLQLIFSWSFRTK